MGTGRKTQIYDNIICKVINVCSNKLIALFVNII